MSLDEWELAEEQYFLMQGLFLLNVSTSSKTLFKAHFGFFGIIADSNESIDSREKAGYLVAVENRESERGAALLVLRSHQMQAMQWNHNPSSQLIPTSASVETSSAKSGNAALCIQMSNKRCNMTHVYFCQMNGPKMAAFLITLASNVSFMNLINEVGAVRLPFLIIFETAGPHVHLEYIIASSSMFFHSS